MTYQESDGSIFQPQNPTKGSYLGNIPIKKALGNSLNVPPFKAVLSTGVDAVVEVARRAGFTTLDGQYGPAISIGGVDITALDLTYGYSVLANNGMMVGIPTTRTYDAGERALDPVMIREIKDRDGNVIWSAQRERYRQQVVPAEQAYLITSILTDGQNTCVTFGCGGVPVPGHIAAVKTGTSEPYDPKGPDAGKIGETWAFGYTPDYVVGVWAGNADNDPIVNIYSTSISYRVMRDTMLAAYDGRTSGNFERPPGIGERRACTGNRCAMELFVKSETPLDAVPVLVNAQPADVPAAVMAERPGDTPTAVLAQAEASATATTPPTPPPPAPTVATVQASPTATATVTLPTPQPTRAAPTPQDPPSQPLAMLLQPGRGSNGSLNVEGWAWSQAMRRYRVEFTPAAGGAWNVIEQSTSPVHGGLLGVWRTADLAPGTYNLRVVVEDASGEYASSPIQVVVGG